MSPGRTAELNGPGLPIPQYTVFSSGSYEPVIQVDPPPSFQVSPFQVSPPGSSGDGIVWVRHRCLPVAGSHPSMKPRVPNSAPEMPVMTTPSATSGATVIEYPSLMSAAFCRQISLPELASRAITLASSVVRKSLPS